MQNTSPEFVAAKAAVVNGVNELVINALINQLATERANAAVKEAKLQAQIDALRPKPVGGHTA